MFDLGILIQNQRTVMHHSFSFWRLLQRRKCNLPVQKCQLRLMRFEYLNNHSRHMFPKHINTYTVLLILLSNKDRTELLFLFFFISFPLLLHSNSNEGSKGEINNCSVSLAEVRLKLPSALLLAIAWWIWEGRCFSLFFLFPVRLGNGGTFCWSTVVS